MMMTEAQLPMVALATMNDTHLEELILINKISAAIAGRDRGQVSRLLEALATHTVGHFGGEEAMMREGGFPPYLMHRAEHERALQEMRMQLLIWNDRHDFDVLAQYIDETLPEWIVSHIRSMDTVTANYLVHGVSSCGGGTC